LGIGGEWAAGAAMVAEVMPKHRRVEAGALLYTASPMGLFLATFVNFQVAAVWLPSDPTSSWRYVFLFGLLPAGVAFAVRWFVDEPERWKTVNERIRTAAAAPKLSELFAPPLRRVTIIASLLSVVSLITWWSCNAFIPSIVTTWAQSAAAERNLDPTATLALVEDWKFRATFWFNLGGLIGTLLTVPCAKWWGRRAMFGIYSVLSALAIFAVFGVAMPDTLRLYAYFLIGLVVFGVCGGYTYYLPELFPTRLRAAGSGFSFNIGRLLAAVGPFVVGTIAVRGQALDALFYVGFVPLIALALLPFAPETKGRELTDS
jgi:MFS family permease